MSMLGWKVFTHDRRSPIQAGPAVWDGSLPFDLPAVPLDTSTEECAPGWNFCRSLTNALLIGSLWPKGRPSLCVAVEAGADAIERGDKCRASTLSILRLATDEEIAVAVSDLSERLLEPHAAVMAEEQMAWRAALARPRREPAAVEAGVTEALAARALTWKLRRFESAWDAWDAQRGLADVRTATTGEPFAGLRMPGRFRAAIRAARAAWDTTAGWAARHVLHDAWDARDARDAWAALTISFASRQGWVKHPADLLTRGLRDAYAAGLEVAIPTGPNELGWAMAP